MTKEQEYTPFGEEWRKEIKRIPKDGIIDILENVCVENIKLRNVSLNPSALDLIAAEREKQISKGYTVEHDAELYGKGQLIDIAHNLIGGNPRKCPLRFAPEYWQKLCSKPYKDRVRIAATWYAKELEILLHLEKEEK